MSNFVVSALKYRPARFEEVVGQEHVAQTLKNALKNDHLAHAFLFCGPRGVGKTTCARILAKVMNCHNVTENFEPCNTCDSCKAFNDNASFNIVELDAASNNSVDHIRQLVEQVRFQPQQGKYKIFIIDEVHMLSQAAFNAFLKTLEEPPPYAVFILATTEKHKIIPTILSRCQIFDFRRIQIPSMVAHLQSICEQESIEADKDALHIIAQKADGALRDSLSIFDRIVSFSGKRITYDDVINNLNVLDYDYYFKLVDSLLMEDISSVLLIFNGILRKGFEGDIFVSGMAEHLRNLLVCKEERTLQLLEVGEALKTRYRQQATMTPNTFLLTALNILNDCDINYKMARHKPLHVEMALIKITYINRAVTIAQNPTAALANTEKKTPELSTSTPSASSSNVTSSPQSSSAPVSVVTEERPVYQVPPTPAPTAVPSPTPPETVESPAASSPVQKTPEKTTAPASSERTSLSGLRKSAKAPAVSLGQAGLAALVQKIKEEKVEETPLEALSLEELKTVWETYVKNIDGNSLRGVLSNSGLKLDGERIIVLVGSKFAENGIRQEKGLMPHLRKTLRRPNLLLSIEIDKSRALVQKGTEKKKADTPQDKYMRMKGINPLVEDIRRKFSLKLDEN